MHSTNIHKTKKRKSIRLVVKLLRYTLDFVHNNTDTFLQSGCVGMGFKLDPEVVNFGHELPRGHGTGKFLPSFAVSR